MLIVRWEIALFCKLWLCVGLCGLQMCAMWVSLKIVFKKCAVEKNKKYRRVGLSCRQTVAWFIIFVPVISMSVCLMVVVSVFTLAPNVLQLGEVADFEALNFKLALMFIWKPNFQFSTEPAILPNCCCMLCFCQCINAVFLTAFFQEGLCLDCYSLSFIIY